MEILGWLWWGLGKALGLVWSFVWFLLGGWVATLAQLLIIAGLFFVWRYGWRRGPQEMWARVQAFGRFVWAWLRMREAGAADERQNGVRAGRDAVGYRVVYARRPGDVSVSTMLTVALLVGMLVVGGM